MKFVPVFLFLLALCSVSFGEADPHIRAVKGYFDAERLAANPIRYIQQAMEARKKAAETEAALIAASAARREKIFRDLMADEWLAADADSVIRLQRKIIEDLQEKLAGQSEELNMLAKQKEETAKSLEEKQKSVDSQIAELQKKIEEQAKLIEEQKQAIAKNSEELKKNIEGAAGTSRERQQAQQRTLNLVVERVTRPLETAVFDGIEFVKIPAGKFTMGTTQAELEELKAKELWPPLFECELPSREITIPRPFFISKFEITQRQWNDLMQKNPAAFKGDDRPVESVSFNEAQEFLRRLRGRSGGDYRLPSEAEWEYCALAGGTGIFGAGEGGSLITFESVGDYAWNAANSDGTTREVGKKKPNAWGLHDMLGNVWEWCQDWYACDFYQTAEDVNKTETTERSFRGGCWALEPHHSRRAIRGANMPSFNSQYLGLRIVRIPRMAD